MKSNGSSSRRQDPAYKAGCTYIITIIVTLTITGVVRREAGETGLWYNSTVAEGGGRAGPGLELDLGLSIMHLSAYDAGL